MKKTKKKTTRQKRDIYKEITDQIIKDLEQGTTPWEKPWYGSKFFLALNHTSGNYYTGINTLILAMAKKHGNYSSNQWMTFKQGKDKGFSVKKGEKSTQIVFYKPLKIEKEKKDGTTTEDYIPMLRTFNVFNLDQFEGTEEIIKQEQEKPNKTQQFERIEKAEKLLKASTATIIHDQKDRAYYNSMVDQIHLCKKDNFRTNLQYYQTALHELIHWTGPRLERPMGNGFGTTAYAKEELIAEMGAAFLCGHLGLEYSTQHADYIQSWLKVLKDDKKAIFKAATMAQKASDYLLEKVKPNKKTKQKTTNKNNQAVASVAA